MGLKPERPASFLITIRSQPKHGILYAAVSQHGSMKALAKFLGISVTAVCWWVNLRNYPRRAFNSPSVFQRARERKQYDTILAKIDTSLDDCWPPEVRQFIDNTAELKSLIFEQTQEVPMERLTGPIMQRLTVDGGAERQMETKELQERMQQVLKTLSYREREIIKLRYGLDNGPTYTLEEVGHIFKLNKERIRQIEAKAMCKLQQPSRSEELIGFID